MDGKILLFALMVHCTCQIPDKQTSTVPTELVHANATNDQVPIAPNEMETRARLFLNVDLRQSCGVSNVLQLRIVGGMPSAPHAWPWMAAIFLRNDFQTVACGGVLISEEYILTAAHCVTWADANALRKRSEYTIRLGEHNLFDSDTTSVDIGVLELIPHPRFNRLKALNDIALIRLSRPVEFDQFIQPICLPEYNENYYQSYVRLSAYVAGWGLLSYKGAKTPSLRQITVPVLDIKDCDVTAKHFGIKVTQEMQICAGYLQGGIDACQGDSGGPLMFLDPNFDRMTTIGVISYGYKCGQPNYPGIYTRVSEFVPWIREITGI